MARAKLYLAVGLCAAMLIVIVQNTEAVETRLIFTSVTMPRALLVGFSFLAGTLCGLLLATRTTAKRRRD